MADRQQPDAFDWHADNEARHVAKHGVPFGFACAIFNDDRRIEAADEQKDYGERRWNVIGIVGTRCLHVTFTMRSGTARIISARLAHREEKRTYGFNP